MRRLPSAVARSLLSHVGMNLHVRRNFADWCAATFLGVTVNSVRELWAYMGANSWTPWLPDPSEAEGVSASARSHDKAQHAMTVRVREAVHVCANGGTTADYANAIHRMQMAGLELGTKYDHHSFLELVEHLAAICCRCLTAREIEEVIPAMDIRSDLSLTWDGVSIGGSMWSRAETLCIIGLGYVGASGHIRHRLIATPSENLRKAGEAQMQLVLQTLANHPARLSLAKLRQCLSIVGGDGAVAAGGADAMHSSTGAAEKVWSTVRPDVDVSCSEWGLFHRIDAAVDRTLRCQPALVELIELSRQMGQLFATGDGRAKVDETRSPINRHAQSKSRHDQIIDTHTLTHACTHTLTHASTRTLTHAHTHARTNLRRLRNYLIYQGNIC